MDDLAQKIAKLEDRVTELEALQKFDSDVQVGMIRELEEEIEEVREVLVSVVDHDEQWPLTASEHSTE